MWVTKLGGIAKASMFSDPSRVIKQPLRPSAYALFELTTSPLSAGPYHPTEDAENPDRVPGTLVLYRRNNTILEVDGSPAERRLTMVLYESGGGEMWRKSLLASDLRHPEVVD